jgi:UDP-N-acetylmuramoylalanine--D-glutamate ligase
MARSNRRQPALTRESLRGARVTVVGLGREGLALARFLAGAGAVVTVTDRQSEEALASRLATLRDLSLRYALGGHPDWALEADVIFVSPGIQRSIPFLAEASRRGIRLSSETELFFSLCPAPIIGITGSSGKTTTTMLVGEMLKAAGFTTWVGGNIGQPLLNDSDKIAAAHRVVLELSSFQLEHLACSPHIGAILNVTPNHLDRHASMQEYIEAKRQIVAHQRRGDAGVFGYDDPEARRLGENYSRRRNAGSTVWFSGESDVARGACLQDQSITVVGAAGRQRVCERGEIQLRGWHNLLNVLAACAIAAEAGAPAEAMRQAATRFAGVEHRLELVREVGGVRYVNDSIATSPERSMAALRSYDEPIVLLAGGRDKHLPWEAWADLAVRRVRALVLFGEAAGLIERAIAEAFQRNAGAAGLRLQPDAVRHVATLEEAVQTAAGLARPGDVVLLSPGGTSFDAFVDFAQRGERFRQLVHAL